jgi:hypothetical protein
MSDDPLWLERIAEKPQVEKRTHAFLPITWHEGKTKSRREMQ